MKAYKSIKILLVILFVVPMFYSGNLQANESIVAVRGGGRVHAHPAAAGHHPYHPEARAYSRGAEAGAAANGAAGAGVVAEPIYSQQPLQTTIPQPVIIENTSK